MCEQHWNTEKHWRRDSSHGVLWLWISARYTTALSSVSCLLHVWRPAHPMILCYYPYPTLTCGFLLSSDYFSSTDSLHLHLSPSSVLSFCHAHGHLLVTSSIHAALFYISPGQSTASSWASATSVKTDDSVLLFFLPTATDPPPGEVCLPRRRGGNEKDWLI